MVCSAKFCYAHSVDGRRRQNLCNINETTCLPRISSSFDFMRKVNVSGYKFKIQNSSSIRGYMIKGI